MPRNPNKAACTVPECRAWAVRGSNPPLCSSHVGRTREGTRGAGAAGRQNARSHGFYGPALDLTELADLAAYADDLTLDDEIACTRVLLRRLMAQIRALPGEYSSPEEGNPKSKIGLCPPRRPRPASRPHRRVPAPRQARARRRRRRRPARRHRPGPRRAEHGMGCRAVTIYDLRFTIYDWERTGETK